MKWRDIFRLGGVALAWALALNVARAQSAGKVTVVDLLVVYTPAARNGAGSSEAMQGQIQAAMVEANLVLQNSRVNAGIRLVRSAEVAYEESGGLYADLDRLRTPNDGFMDDVHVLRDQTAADLVCLITETSNDWWFYGFQGPSAANAFSVIRREFLTGGNYLPVALSFNFGCQMERQNADSVGAFPYAYGHSFPTFDGSIFGTVESMTWNRLPWFSNPNLEFQEFATGVRAGEPYAADNARVLNNTAPIVSAFRGLAQTTVPPIVRIASPVGTASMPFQITQDSVLNIVAEATDTDGQVVRVDYFESDTGGVNQRFLGSATSEPFTFAWSNAPVGDHALFAMAVDNLGASARSSQDLVLSVQPTPPRNDNFANAVLLVGSNISVLGRTTSSTLEEGEQDWGGGSVWYSWTAPQNGNLLLSFPDWSYVTVFGAAIGETVSNLTVVATDLAPWGGWFGSVGFDVLAGTNYDIFVVGASGDLAEFTLQLDFQPTVLVRITSPVTDSRFTAGDGVEVAAWATAPTPSGVDRVEFFADLSLIGVATNPPFSIVWTNQVPGTRLLMARAIDAVGRSNNSPTVSVSISPSNDNFVSRLRLDGTSITAPGSNHGATKEPDEPLHAGLSDGKSVWWTWTAPATGQVTVTVSAISVWPSVGIYTGNELASLSSVASNYAFYGYPSVTSFNVSAGTEYQVAVSGPGAGPAEGEFSVNIEFTPPPTNDQFANRSSFTGTSATGWNVMASKESGEPSHAGNPGGHSAWWSWTSESSVGVRFSLTTDGFTPLLAIYVADQLTNLIAIAAGTNRPLEFRAEAGVNYQIAADGLNGGSGHYTLSLITAASNDDFTNAITVTGSSLVITGSNVAATREQGEPSHAGQGGGKSLWWSWVAPFSGWVDLNPFGTTFDLRLAVYSGSALTNLVELDATQGYAGDVLSLQAVSGKVYWIAADAFEQGLATTTGDLILRLEEARAPLNDNFANRIVLSGTNISLTASNVGAGLEPGEPNLGYLAQHSVWWTWTAPFSGHAVVRADPAWGSGMLACLATFTGNVLSNLTPIGLWERQNYSAVNTFNAIGGTTYQFGADMLLGGTGDFTLSLVLEPPPLNDAFANRILLSGTNIAVHASNVGATREPGEPLHGGVQGEASIWWSWTAPGEGIATLSVAGEALFAPLWGVYRGNQINALTLQPLTSGYLSVHEGWTYHIAADGHRTDWASATGPIHLQVSYTPLPSNDNFANREPLQGTALEVHGWNRGATTEPGEPNLGTGGRSIWWSWTAPASGSVTLDTAGSDLFTAMRVYTGNTITNLMLVVGGNTRVAFEAQGGTTYQIWVDEYFPGAGGNISLNLLLSTLRITSPTNGSRLYGQTNVLIEAESTELDGPFRVMSFVAGNEVIGELMGPPYIFSWSNAPYGNFMLEVRVTNEAGVVRYSPPVVLSIHPANDNYTNRSSIGGISNIVVGNNINSTTEPGEPGIAGCCSVWWSWRAPASGRATVSTLGSAFLPVLGIFTGESLTELSLVTNSSAGPMGPTYDSVSFAVTSGTEYPIGAATWFGFVGGIQLTVTMAETPTNNNFSNRIEFVGNQADMTGSTFAADAEVGEPDHAGQKAERSVWWTWTAPAKGRVQLDVTANGWSPLLAVYTGDSLTNLAEVASSAGSSIFFHAESMTTYLIALDGNAGSAGDYALKLKLIPLPDNDSFSNRFELIGAADHAAGTILTATKESGEPDHADRPGGRSVWWTWTPRGPGRATFSVTTAGWSPLLAVYTGDALTNLFAVAAVSGSSLSFFTPGGVTYQIALDSGDQAAADFNLSLALVPAPPNDRYDDRVVLLSNLAHLRGNNASASHETHERLPSGADGKTVWWTWIAPSNGTVIIAKITNNTMQAHSLQKHTFTESVGSSTAGLPAIPSLMPRFSEGQSHGPLVTVYSGTDLTNLTMVASNSYFYLGDWTFPPGWAVSDQLFLPVATGMAYQICVDSCNGSAGDFDLEFIFVPPPPNDAFASRTILNGPSISVQGHNFSATKQTDEPDHAGQPGGASVWWTWTASALGRMTIEVASQFSPLIAVYTGAAIDGLVSVASGGPSITFLAKPGITYQIAVDGVDAAQGRLDLSVSPAPPPVNDMFAASIPLFGQQIDVAGSTVNATPEPGEPLPPKSTTGASVWYRWCAPSSGHVSLSVVTWPANLVVYAGSTLTNLLLVSKSSQADEFWDAEFYAVAGQLYQIAVSDDTGTEGDFAFRLTAPPPQPWIDTAFPPVNLSQGFSLMVRGMQGQSFVVQASTNLVNWETIKIDTILGSSAESIDEKAAQFPMRFYRVLPLDEVLATSNLHVGVVPSSGSSGFGVRIFGPAGQPFSLKASSDLTHWGEIYRGWIVGDFIDFADEAAPSLPSRFYQVVPQP